MAYQDQRMARLWIRTIWQLQKDQERSRRKSVGDCARRTRARTTCTHLVRICVKSSSFLWASPTTSKYRNLKSCERWFRSQLSHRNSLEFEYRQLYSTRIQTRWEAHAPSWGSVKTRFLRVAKSRARFRRLPLREPFVPLDECTPTNHKEQKQN